MAGQPRKHGKVPRQRSRPRWAERAASAVTPARRYALAYDRLRAALADLRRSRDPEAELARMQEADRLASEAAIFLNGLAEHAERLGDRG